MKKRVKINLFHKTTLFTRNMTSNFFKTKLSKKKLSVNFIASEVLQTMIYVKQVGGVGSIWERI